MTSFDRLDDAYIGQEIVQLNYARPLPVYHATARATAERYLAEQLIIRPPLPLERGAIDLLQAAFAAAMRTNRYDYIVHLEADTWILDERIIEKYVERLEASGAELVSCGWTPPGRLGAWLARFGPIGRGLLRFSRPKDLCTQFFIAKASPVMSEVIGRLGDMPGHTVEQRFKAAFERHAQGSGLQLFRERHPVTPRTRYECAGLALFAQHWPAKGTSEDPRPSSDGLRVPTDAPGKREGLERYASVRNGPHLLRLLHSSNLDYYNMGARRY